METASAAKPNLADLSSELLDLILRHCSEAPGKQRNYISLCLVNRRLRDVATPLLYEDIHLRSRGWFVHLILTLQSDFLGRTGSVKSITWAAPYPDPRDRRDGQRQGPQNGINPHIPSFSEMEGRFGAIFNLPLAQIGLLSKLESLEISDYWLVKLELLISLWSAPRLKRFKVSVSRCRDVDLPVLPTRAPALEHAHLGIPNLDGEVVKALAAVRSTHGLSLWPKHSTSHHLMELFAPDLTNLELIFKYNRSPEEVPNLQPFARLKTLRIDIMDLFQLNGCVGPAVNWETDPDYLECNRDSVAFVERKLQLWTIPPPTLTHLIVEAGIWRVPHKVFETLIIALIEQPSAVLPQLCRLEIALLTQEWVRRWGKGLFTQIDKYTKWRPVDLSDREHDCEASADDVESDDEDDYRGIYCDNSRAGKTCTCLTRSSEGIVMLLRLRAVCEDAGIEFAAWRKGPWSHIKTWM